MAENPRDLEAPEEAREEDNGECDHEEGEEEEEEEEEEEYSFRFEDGVNPLDFVEGNAFTDQPYKQFERLEYEALAEKKRKALADNQQCEGSASAKKARVEEACRANMEEIMKSMNYGSYRRKSREPKKRGRQRGSKNKPNREVSQKLGEATLYYAHGRYKEAVSLLHQIILQAPHLPDAYHTLGLVYNSMGDKERSLGFYMLAAHLMPRDSSLWKLLVSWSTERGDTAQATYCLSKAITADPKDIQLRLQRASLYIELRDFQKAAESYHQIYQLSPENVEALKRGAKLYQRCDQVEQSIHILEDYLKCHPTEADLSVVDMLASLLIDIKEYEKALQHVEHVCSVYCLEKDSPLNLAVKAGICHCHLGNLQKAEALFGILEGENAARNINLVNEVAATLVDIGHHDLALKYYMTVQRVDGSHLGALHLNIAQCYSSLNDRLQAIAFYHKALEALPNNIDARLTLASLLLEENKDDEAIILLSPLFNSDDVDQPSSQKSKPWWVHEKVKLKICHIYRDKGMLREFVDTIFPLVRESLYCFETQKQKVKVKKRLKRRDLHERVKVLNNRGTDNLFQGFRPVAPSSDLLKAARARRLLQQKEEKKAKALASGVDWQSDDGSDYEPMFQERREAPLPNILKDEEHDNLIMNLCKALASLERYSDALKIISLTLRLANTTLSPEKKEVFRMLGAQLAYGVNEPKHGFEYVKYIVQQHPYSIASWNCYYKVISRMENRDTRHNKFIQFMQNKHKDCVPPIIISAHHLTAGSAHQDAARKYLEAYRLLPENPLINLCVGTALVNLALGLRIDNRHLSLAQGLAFLFNNLRLCKNSQESLYNIARAYHHVGLVTLAVTYYEKVLDIREEDHRNPSLYSESLDFSDRKRLVCCDLRREAAYNLHLIYKKSGASDLARQVLKDHCTF